MVVTDELQNSGSEFQGNFVFRIFLKINDQLFGGEIPGNDFSGAPGSMEAVTARCDAIKFSAREGVIFPRDNNFSKSACILKHMIRPPYRYQD